MKIEHFLYDYLVRTGMSDIAAKYLNMFALLIALLVISYMIDFIIRKIIVGFFTRISATTKTNFDNL